MTKLQCLWRAKNKACKPDYVTTILIRTSMKWLKKMTHDTCCLRKFSTLMVLLNKWTHFKCTQWKFKLPESIRGDHRYFWIIKDYSYPQWKWCQVWGLELQGRALSTSPDLGSGVFEETAVFHRSEWKRGALPLARTIPGHWERTAVWIQTHSKRRQNSPGGRHTRENLRHHQQNRHYWRCKVSNMSVRREWSFPSLHLRLVNLAGSLVFLKGPDVSGPDTGLLFRIVFNMRMALLLGP